MGWIDGRLAPLTQAGIAVDDPAFHAGVGVFETIALRDGRLLELDQHLVRLRHAAAYLDVPLPDTLAEGVEQVRALDHPAFAWIKIVATRGGRCAVFGGTLDPEEYGRSMTAVLVPWRRNPRSPLNGLKTLNYADSVLGAEYARRAGADEGLWLNTRGHLAEGCTSNLFIVEGRRLFTPAVRDGVLPGVVRGLVLESARELGYVIHEGKVRLLRLEQAREAFLTSSLRAVRPLVAFQGRPIGGGVPGAATRELAEAVAGARGLPDAGVAFRRHRDGEVDTS